MPVNRKQGGEPKLTTPVGQPVSKPKTKAITTETTPETSAGWSTKGAKGRPTVTTAVPTMRIPGYQASVGLNCTNAYKAGGALPEIAGLPPKLAKLQTDANELLRTQPKMLTERFRAMVDAAADGGVPTFAVDDAKGALCPEEWLGTEPTLSSAAKQFRASGASAALHQAAHGVTQLAFIERLDELAKLPAGDQKRNILVTNGGCGAGKGYALESGLGKEFTNDFGAVWDAAGEQAALDNQWILKEADKRGLKTTMLFVHAKPEGAFDRAITKRFTNEGRLVNIKSFAESYIDAPGHMTGQLRDLVARGQTNNVSVIVADNTGPTPRVITYGAKKLGEAADEIDAITKGSPKHAQLEATLKELAQKSALPSYGHDGLNVLG